MTGPVHKQGWLAPSSSPGAELKRPARFPRAPPICRKSGFQLRDSRHIGTPFCVFWGFVPTFRHLSFKHLGGGVPGNVRTTRTESHFMGFQHIAAAHYRALTAGKDCPSLYDVCDPLLLNGHGGDPHLTKFYRTALGNPALRPLLRRTGLAELREAARLARLQQALLHARDDEAPDWAAIGRPVADLLDTIEVEHPQPRPVDAPQRAPDRSRIEAVIRDCAAHLLRSFSNNGFIPTYAAFNLKIG